MGKDNQQIPPRAMILSRKYRTLVSSWIEPLQEEAELGYEIDFVARWRSYGGAQVVGATQRKTPLDPDAERFIYSNPMETSFKQRCLEDWKLHHRKLLKTLKNEGLACLGDASESDYVRVEERLRKIIKGPDQNVPKPKAASKMIVAELKEELEAQGLPTDGTRNVLYQRVQKARRINRSRGRPLWVPPVEEEEEEVDEELDRLISRIKLEDGNTEFWRRRFLGEDLNEGRMTPTNTEKTELLDTVDEEDVVDDVAKEEDEVDEEEEVEPTENQDGDMAKEKEVETAKPLQMIGVQLLKDVDQTPTRKGKSRRRSSRISVEDDNDDDWLPEDVREALNVIRERKIFDVSRMYTIADGWGWTWERELRNRPPRKWSQEWEVELAMQVMLKAKSKNSTLPFVDPIIDFDVYTFKHPPNSTCNSGIGRIAGNGFWHANTGGTEVMNHLGEVIGYRTSLVYYMYDSPVNDEKKDKVIEKEDEKKDKVIEKEDKKKGKSPSTKTNWIMNEFKLLSSKSKSRSSLKGPMWTICKIGETGRTFGGNIHHQVVPASEQVIMAADQPQQQQYDQFQQMQPQQLDNIDENAQQIRKDDQQQQWQCDIDDLIGSVPQDQADDRSSN
ncbi:hypothetical protein Syun_006492 [Stephania yunnanensis]|uniref:SAP domain-containing protein n=1 Tax=Stephania yunnanensis TaxID=152371 RepID=A0AAP0Q1E6_9MAGN